MPYCPRIVCHGLFADTLVNVGNIAALVVTVVVCSLLSLMCWCTAVLRLIDVGNFRLLGELKLR